MAKITSSFAPGTVVGAQLAGVDQSPSPARPVHAIGAELTLVKNVIKKKKSTNLFMQSYLTDAKERFSTGQRFSGKLRNNMLLSANDS
jgi:hypothetical protein